MSCNYEFSYVCLVRVYGTRGREGRRREGRGREGGREGEKEGGREREGERGREGGKKTDRQTDYLVFSYQSVDVHWQKQWL